MRSAVLAAAPVALLAGVVLALLAGGGVTTAPALAASTWREQFALDLLSALGNDAPSVETIAFVVEWTIAEDSGDGAGVRHNPLNTTQASAAETHTINGDGVRGYATYQDGLDATVTTLTNGLYADLVYALLANDADGALAALIASPWAASHYNGGAGWPRVEIGAPEGAKARVTETMEVSAGFYATGSPYWNGGYHGGIDYAAPPGSPIFMPFDCQYQMTGYYADEGRRGEYLICVLADGMEYYSGHLTDVQAFAPGAIIPAGALVGYTNDLAHTHVQLRDGAGNLLDFDTYWREQ